MIQRFGITLASEGAQTTVFASRRGAVYVELLTKVPERLAVLATPMPSFDVDSDFIVAVVQENGESHIDTIHGKCPDGLLDAHVLPHIGAILVASANQF